MRLTLSVAPTETSATIRAELSGGQITISIDIPGASGERCAGYVRAIGATIAARLQDDQPGMPLQTAGSFEGVLPGDPWTT